MTGTLEEKRRLRRDQILDSAARIFARDGFHAARMDDIAAELHLTKAALGRRSLEAITRISGASEAD